MVMAAFLSSSAKSGDVAERSPAVISANLKEDMLLQKKMVVLNRSERSVVHQIKVDQKVLYKRFQARLVRSKLAHARLLGQRELERELRARNLGGLNTNIAGTSEEEFLFLEKLEHRPCMASSFSPRVGIAGKGKCSDQNNHDAVEQFDDNTAADNTNQPVPGRSASSLARYDDLQTNAKQKGDGKGVAKALEKESEESHLKLRPATTMGMRVDDEFIKHKLMLQAASSNKSKSDNKLSKVTLASETAMHAQLEEPVTTNCEESSSEITGSENENSEGTETGKVKGLIFSDQISPQEPLRPNTVAHFHGFSEDHVDQIISNLGSPASPKQMDRKPSKQSADFFQEGKKVDLVSLRLKQARAHNYSEQVKKFCTDLENVSKDKKSPDVDYYSMRLQLSLAHTTTRPCDRVPGTPEEENKRSVGDIFVRSLTMPHINWNFTNPR
ncbi:uncharacterized protein LOC127873763 [Dreissena polymorpha]|uniref:Uncharacterized protein n=1 Tax=Dreissena polymorpha TaxID=45954 RepID=A0A9D4QYX9_DREPO|nr:uncharacterized protein LOC127873763 [Dreissena polymorpha]KAH3847967.1 hypothetical protein DPMN_090303 [Dreissena polymorpha]